MFTLARHKYHNHSHKCRCKNVATKCGSIQRKCSFAGFSKIQRSTRMWKFTCLASEDWWLASWSVQSRPLCLQLHQFSSHEIVTVIKNCNCNHTKKQSLLTLMITITMVLWLCLCLVYIFLFTLSLNAPYDCDYKLLRP